MKKNLILKFIFLFSLFLTLLSCRTDLTDYQKGANETQQSYTAKQLSYNELKQQFPSVVDKVSNIKTLVKPSSVNSKIYTDIEDEFSIDTEKSLYIEDERGNKTYTFEVKTEESTPDILENLVLKDIGNNEFEAYISTYDKYAIENLTKLTSEELKGHVTLIQIGNKKGADIFGKYNANLCTMSYLSDVINVYIPGTTCSSPLHHTYSQIGICQDDIKPTPGYYDSVFIYNTADICSGGSTGNGSVSTAPIGGASPGGGTGGSVSTEIKLDPSLNNTKIKCLLQKMSKDTNLTDDKITLPADPANDNLFQKMLRKFNGLDTSKITFKGANLGSAYLGETKSTDEGASFEITINTEINSNLFTEASLIHELVHALMLNDLNQLNPKLITWQLDGTATIANNIEQICNNNNFNSNDPYEHLAATICKHLNIFNPSNGSNPQWMHELFGMTSFDNNLYTNTLINYLSNNHEWDNEAIDWKNNMELQFGNNWKTTVSTYVVMDALRKTNDFSLWWGNNSISVYDDMIYNVIEKGQLPNSNIQNPLNNNCN
jgi:hypothetical protein